MGFLSDLTTVLSILIVWLAPPLVWALVIVVFPKFFSDTLLRAIDHKHNIRLEEIKAELGRENARKIETLKSDDATLKSSIELLSGNQSEIRARRLVAIEKMWNVFLQLKQNFGGVIYLDTILLPTELDEFFRGKKPSEYIGGIIKQYEREDATAIKFDESGANEIEKERPFVGERSWQIFYALRALYGRSAILIRYSVQKKQYQNWKDDKLFATNIGTVLSKEIIDAAKAMQMQGLQMIVLHITEAFLEEAEHILSGRRTAANLIPDYQEILLAERDKLTNYRAPGAE
jgi:hypothetical protein